MMQIDNPRVSPQPGSGSIQRRLPLLMAAALPIVLSACATAPPRHEMARYWAPEPAPAAAIYVYPATGQSPGQLDRDRYGCHLWAVQQTGFDPAVPVYAPRQTSTRAVPPDGASTVAGAATGAVLGAIVSRPGNAGKGAVIGAVAGSLVGAAADSAQQQQADRYNDAMDQRRSRWQSRQEREANGYRRAFSACLVGRGYTVK